MRDTERRREERGRAKRERERGREEREVGLKGGRERERRESDLEIWREKRSFDVTIHRYAYVYLIKLHTWLTLASEVQLCHCCFFSKI